MIFTGILGIIDAKLGNIVLGAPLPARVASVSQNVTVADTATVAITPIPARALNASDTIATGASVSMVVGPPPTTLAIGVSETVGVVESAVVYVTLIPARILSVTETAIGTSDTAVAYITSVAPNRLTQDSLVIVNTGIAPDLLTQDSLVVSERLPDIPATDNVVVTSSTALDHLPSPEHQVVVDSAIALDHLPSPEHLVTMNSLLVLTPSGPDTFCQLVVTGR